MSAYNLQGELVEAELSGLAARVVQHETDHLDGVLFIDRLGVAAEMSIRDSLLRLEQQYEEQLAAGAVGNDTVIAQRRSDWEEQFCRSHKTPWGVARVTTSSRLSISVQSYRTMGQSRNRQAAILPHRRRVTSMRILVMATGEFAVPTLDWLLHVAARGRGPADAAESRSIDAAIGTRQPRRSTGPPSPTCRSWRRPQ